LSDLASEEISFLDRSMNCCIGFVNMLNSTSITAEIYDRRKKIGQYYSIFINTMAALVKNYGAKIVKNAGDALIFYFPQTSDASNEQAFNDAFECFTTMILARDIINAKLHSEGLPSVSYRISADYGKVEVATSTSSRGGEDLFGSTMNICAKINSMAEANGVVIGGDLYRIIKPFSFIDYKYELRELKGGYSIGFNHEYPVYRASLSKNNNTSEMAINNIHKLFTPKKTSSKIKEDIQAKQQQSSQLLQQSQQVRQHQQEYSANIMIVADEPDILSTYECFLSDEGYNVQAFTDPQEALKHFVQLPDPSSHYKLALLDIRMPRINGLQLFHRIKTLSPKIKIMFISALDIAEELTSILPDMKHDEVIKKPVERKYFLSKINSALQEH
ncbi:MAG: response regulator, partial [Thermoproteota archaeon]|nr:response regulator [Thermoproteota archaeon]